MYTLEGVSSVANFIITYEESPKAIVLTFILLHCNWCKCRDAAVERLPVHH